jgi:hypothetical protein
VSRNANQLDVFVVDGNGHVQTSWWNPDDDWSNHAWREISQGATFPAGAPVAAVSRNANQLDVFVVDGNGHVQTSWWNPDDDWSDHAWRDISAGSVFPAGAPVAAVSRNANQLDVFAVEGDGHVYTSWWNPHQTNDWSNHPWREIGGLAIPIIPPPPVSYTAQWWSPDGIPVQGFVTYTLYPNGDFSVRFHTHDASAFEAYTFKVVAALLITTDPSASPPATFTLDSEHDGEIAHGRPGEYTEWRSDLRICDNWPAVVLRARMMAPNAIVTAGVTR